jgi:hypothetical protein
LATDEVVAAMTHHGLPAGTSVARRPDDGTELQTVIARAAHFDAAPPRIATYDIRGFVY